MGERIKEIFDFMDYAEKDVSLYFNFLWFIEKEMCVQTGEKER